MSEVSEEIREIGAKDAAYTVFSGFCMGSADVVPGVSGGTMAVALGIYHRLLAAITSADKEAVISLLRFDLKKLFSRLHWRFLGALLVGVAVGIVVMVKGVKLPQLIAPDSPARTVVYALFFGMVLGSAGTLSRHLGQWTPGRYLAVVFGAGVGFGVVNLVPVDTPTHPVFIFFCGAIAICAMLLPGISGSFILLILGKYAYILGALADLNLGVVLPFVAGCATGLLAFSRLLKWLLDHFQDTMLATLIGLLLGSLWRIWPYQELTVKIVREKPRVLGAEPFWPSGLDASVVVALLVGLALVVGLEVYAAGKAQRAALDAG
ncbi:MAG: DUF368 domain-containing protein [Myxococcota bacterium]